MEPSDAEGGTVGCSDLVGLINEAMALHSEACTAAYVAGTLNCVTPSKDVAGRAKVESHRQREARATVRLRELLQAAMTPNNQVERQP